jgi:regulator of sigma E protease
MPVLAILVFVGLLLALVLAHELGHFWAARSRGCRVEEFGFGFPPKLFSWKRGETIYSVNLLPIGGFVRIEGEDMDEVRPTPTSFASKSPGARIFILAAGVMMNVVLATFLLTIQAGVGVPTLVMNENNPTLSDIRTYITGVTPGSPAEQAGLKPLDSIVAVGEATDPTLETVQSVTRERGGEKIPIVVERQGEQHQFEVLARLNPPPNEGAMGVSLATTGLQKHPWWKAPWIGVKRTGELTSAIVRQFWLLLQRIRDMGLAEDTLTGPIGIAIYTQEATHLGIQYLLEFAALVSLNLAIINILPFPALDGGRIAFVMIEKLRGRRLSGRFERITHTVGFAILIILMIVVTFKDIRRYFY